MSVEDFNNGLIMGLSLQGTMFVDRGSHSTGGIEILCEKIFSTPQIYNFIFTDFIVEEVLEI